MNRRLYFMLPDLASANRVADDLLLARLDDRFMHFLAKSGTELGKLREAGVTHKSDLMHGAELGLKMGAVCGLAIGIYLYFFQPVGIHLQLIVILIAEIAGALFGIWTGSMAGAAIPNSKLSQFEAAIEKGQVLLILDVAYERVEEIKQIIESRHPELVSSSFEPTMPAFP